MDRPRLGRTLRFLVCLGLTPPCLPAQAPTTVAVHAKLVAERFRVRFEPELGEVERAVAKRFASLLAREVGFLRFAVEDDSAIYRLVFALDRRERGDSAHFAEFGFWARLERPADVPLELYWLTFREADQATAGVGTAEEFLGDLAARLTDADPGALLDSLLDKVPITTQALPQMSPLGWALRFPHLELCIKNRSELELISEVRTGAMVLENMAQARVVGEFRVESQPTPEIQPFLGGIFSQPMSQAAIDELTRLLSQETVKVKEVYVIAYVHDPNACRDRGEGGAP